MSDPFDRLIAPLLDREGGYANNPADAGGETNHGITVAVARANGYAGRMAAMTRAQAVEIYRRVYWTKPGLHLVDELAPAVAEELFDTGVNMGPATAAKFLQRALNVLNQGGAHYRDVAVDGAIGPASVGALRAFLTRRGEAGAAVLLKALNCLQGARYIELAEQRAQNEAFLYGWLAQRVSLGA